MKRIGAIVIVCALLFTLCPVSVRAAPAEVAAKSAILMDAATGTILYEQNAHERLASSSPW